MDFLHWITDLIWPHQCFGCGAYQAALCPTCLAGIPSRRNQECIICQRVSRYGRSCQSCSTHTMLDRLLIAGHLDTPLLHQCIHRFKYSYITDLAGPLAEYAFGAFSKLESASSLCLDNPLVIPVPLHRRRLTERGFNQSELLAQQLAARLHLRHEPGILVRTRYTASQAHSDSRADRLQNMHDAFRVPHPERVQDMPILLVDDVCTTGATLDACASALKSAGATTVTALVLARG